MVAEEVAEVDLEVVEVVAAEVAERANPQIGTPTPMLKNSVNSSLVGCLQTLQKIQ